MPPHNKGGCIASFTQLAPILAFGGIGNKEWAHLIVSPLLESRLTDAFTRSGRHLQRLSILTVFFLLKLVWLNSQSSLFQNDIFA